MFGRVCVAVYLFVCMCVCGVILCFCAFLLYNKNTLSAFYVALRCFVHFFRRIFADVVIFFGFCCCFLAFVYPSNAYFRDNFFVLFLLLLFMKIVVFFSSF